MRDKNRHLKGNLTTGLLFYFCFLKTKDSPEKACYIGHTLHSVSQTESHGRLNCLLLTILVPLYYLLYKIRRWSCSKLVGKEERYCIIPHTTYKNAIKTKLNRLMLLNNISQRLVKSLVLVQCINNAHHSLRIFVTLQLLRLESRTPGSIFERKCLSCRQM